MSTGSGPADSTLERQGPTLPEELWDEIVNIADASDLDLKNFRLACRHFDRIAERFVLSRAVIYCDTDACILGSSLTTRWNIDRFALYANTLTLHVQTDSQSRNDRLREEPGCFGPLSFFTMLLQDFERYQSYRRVFTRFKTLMMTDSHMIAALSSPMRTRLLSQMPNIKHLKLIADPCQSDLIRMGDALEANFLPFLETLSIVGLPVQWGYRGSEILPGFMFHYHLWYYNAPWHRHIRELTFWDINTDIPPSCTCDLRYWHPLIREPEIMPNLEVLVLHTNVEIVGQLGPTWKQLIYLEDGKIFIPAKGGESLSNVAAWEKTLVSTDTLKGWHMIRKKSAGDDDWKVASDVDAA